MLLPGVLSCCVLPSAVITAKVISIELLASCVLSPGVLAPEVEVEVLIVATYVELNEVTSAAELPVILQLHHLQSNASYATLKTGIMM